MPELTFYRTQPERNPARMICMYCGAEAQHQQEWLVENRREVRNESGDGGSLASVTTGDDPVSGVIAILMLPFALWELLKSIAGAVGAIRRARVPEAEPKKLPPLDPPTTLVTVTTCDRHRRFSRRFVWAGMVMAVVLAVLWYSAVRTVRAEMGGVDSLLGTLLLSTALIGTIVGPLALAFWYTLAGPVIVDRVGEETVTLDRVRTAYFEAAEIPVTE